MKFSSFGNNFSNKAGIVQLMDDLGDALSVNKSMLMLGGGNPGQIPEMQARFRQRMVDILDAGDQFERLIGDYDPPQGETRFREALAALLRREFDWPLSADNIAITNGSQSASFMLFNMLAGRDDAGAPRRILLPLTPEYIGYADQGVMTDMFTANRPTIEHLADHLFKYHVDFDKLTVGDDISAICVSRPTNPTGNVLTDDEVAKLMGLARRHDVPLILDNAYGTPFPHIIFSDATPVWDDNVILCMSLSKLGLPGVRTGIVIANEQIIRGLASVNAIVNLTTGGFGAALTVDMIESGEIISISNDIIRPFYQDKADQAVDLIRRQFAGYEFAIHKPEGAIFLWLWFPGLPISCAQLYQRLKDRGVLVIPGHYFFPGLSEDWEHKHECIRLTYSQPADVVERGIAIIADVVKGAYDGG
ncbi:MAG: valine--pyruvate transaminase [Gammaproteobacteria bacterium]|jgi:valine--pyruvate aminotransferase|nr:valine--pyruvate transaminase [Gammaproteobacteria bacterium]